MMEPRRSIDVSSRGPARVRDAGRRVREPQRMSTDARLRRPSSLARNLMVGRLLRGLGLLGVSALAALGVLQVAAWVERSESFGRALPIRTVAVHGVEGPRVDEVLAYAAVTVGAPLFSVDVEAVAAYQLCTRTEGIIPALESAHAVAHAVKIAGSLPKDHLMVINMSGRGDKDLDSVGRWLAGHGS